MNKLNQLLMGTTTLLLTAVMLTSCGGGTSSNTGGGKAQYNNNNPQPSPTTVPTPVPPVSKVVSIPLLGRNFTITKGKTTQDDIGFIASQVDSCDNLWGPVPPDPPSVTLRVCISQVNSAVQEARDFIK
ncbi:MAG: hypothetical protein ACKPI9_15100 [Dolichospermum sp.]